MIPTNYEGSVINALPSMGVTTLVHSSCAFKLAFKLFLLYDKGAGGYAIGSHLGSIHTDGCTTASSLSAKIYAEYNFNTKIRIAGVARKGLSVAIMV